MENCPLGRMGKVMQVLGKKTLCSWECVVLFMYVAASEGLKPYPVRDISCVLFPCLVTSHYSPQCHVSGLNVCVHVLSSLLCHIHLVACLYPFYATCSWNHMRTDYATHFSVFHVRPSASSNACLRVTRQGALCMANSL